MIWYSSLTPFYLNSLLLSDEICTSCLIFIGNISLFSRLPCASRILSGIFRSCLPMRPSSGYFRKRSQLWNSRGVSWPTLVWGILLLMTRNWMPYLTIFPAAVISSHCLWAATILRKLAFLSNSSLSHVSMLSCALLISSRLLLTFESACPLNSRLKNYSWLAALVAEP